jgi:hypothetical protein
MILLIGFPFQDLVFSSLYKKSRNLSIVLAQIGRFARGEARAKVGQETLLGFVFGKDLSVNKKETSCVKFRHENT